MAEGMLSASTNAAGSLKNIPLRSLPPSRHLRYCLMSRLIASIPAICFAGCPLLDAVVGDAKVRFDSRDRLISCLTSLTVIRM